jgi:hypothetical protein
MISDSKNYCCTVVLYVLCTILAYWILADLADYYCTLRTFMVTICNLTNNISLSINICTRFIIVFRLR